MLHIVTGAAGFIGSRLVEALNARSVTDIVAVDTVENGAKVPNLARCTIAEYVDKRELLTRLKAGRYDGKVAAVLHQGACSDTMETDRTYVMETNFEYSCTLLEWCQARAVPFLYASSAAVYGAGKAGFRETPECEAPLNLYGESKLRFDQHVRRKLSRRTAQIVGLRYFNVYGPNEAHKGRMASVALHALNQLRTDGRVKLFVGSGGYRDGEQRRDFVYVDDAVAVNLHFLERGGRSGIWNCGTGRAETFNAVAAAVINTVRGTRASASALVAEGLIEYVPFPPALVGRYQSFTQADPTELRAAGLTHGFRGVAEGVAAYVRQRLAS